MKSLISILLIIPAFASFAQPSIRGHVIDGETNTPLPGASVFLANTTHGVGTDVDGGFIIGGLRRSVHYQLVVSFVGYGAQVIDVVAGDPVSYRIVLKPVTRNLREVVVRAKKRSHTEWLANFKLFRELFVGITDNGMACAFQNPNVLDFENDDESLSAFADSILIVDNNGLGYRMKVLLENYRFDMVRLFLHYEGHVVFEPLVPADHRQKAEWARNRLKAYFGSQMHFLRSLSKHQLIEEGYYVNFIEDGVVRKSDYDTTISVRSPIFKHRIKMHTITNYDRILDSLGLIAKPDEPVMSFQSNLEVQYVMEAESYIYQAHRSIKTMKTPQRSTIILHRPAIVQSNGQLYPSDAIEVRGYWSWELLAESIPLDYEPDEDLQILGEN